MKNIIIIGVFLSLLIGCENPDPDPDPDPKISYFGYLGTAMEGMGAGNYIADLSSSSNVATISCEDPENIDCIIDLIIEARNNGMKSIIWVDHLFFSIENWGTLEQELYLYPDYQERWDRYSLELEPYVDNIYMFYVLDEPYWNGSHVGISQADMLVMLETVASAIKITFPDINIGSCFVSVSIDEDFELPINYTLIGFDYYYSPGQNMELYFEKYNNYLEIFMSKMHSHQKLFLVPGGFQFAHNPASQKDLIQVADFFYDLFLDETLVETMIVFLYPSVSPGLIGLEALPELMVCYEEIGNLIINPDKIIELEPEIKPEYNIQVKPKNTISISDERFNVLYDETINEILGYYPDPDDEIDLYEQANALVEKAQVIADGLFCDEKTVEHIQYLISVLTKDYAELCVNMKKKVLLSEK